VTEQDYSGKTLQELGLKLEDIYEEVQTLVVGLVKTLILGA